MNWSVALGLALLYGSAHFLPLLSPLGRYLVPSPWTYILVPTLVVAVILAPAFSLIDRMLVARGHVRGRAFFFWVLGTLFVTLALGSLLAAADRSLDTFIGPTSPSPQQLMQYRQLRVAVPAALIVCTAIALWPLRSRLQKLLEYLSILGYSFAVLAIIRIASHPAIDAPPRASHSAVDTTLAPRRVVWIIFDELDYEETLGLHPVGSALELPNLNQLRGRAASATSAWSPAKDTQDSLPALLMGTPILGSRFDADGSLWIRVAADEVRRFTEADTVFARLPGGPGSAAVLGYFHPYCKLFGSLAACRSYFLGNAGRWFDGLFFFSANLSGLIRWTPAVTMHIPDTLLEIVDPMYRISTAMLRAAPEALRRTDLALTFIHFNIPHYPADYAQHALHLPRRPEDGASYRDNALLVDRTLGEIMQVLSAQQRAAPGQELLLVLSSDHWHRISSPDVARPIPFFAWHVGEVEPVPIPMPISTMHTEAMILDFLNGKVTTQAQIARWWRDEPVFPTWIPVNQKF